MAAEMATFGEGHGAEHLPNGAAPVQAARAYVTILARGRAGYGDQELGAVVHEPGMSFGEALLGKNRAAELRALYSNATGFAPLEHGMPFGEALLGKNRIGGLAAPYSNADASAREHGVGVTLGEPLLGKNRPAGLDAAPGSNADVFGHPRGMAACEALHATPAAPYAVQVSIDKALGANAGGPIVVEANAAGADARDVRARGGNLSAFVGIVAASSAVTAVAGTISPAVAFGFFVVLLGGLCLAVSTVRRA